MDFIQQSPVKMIFGENQLGKVIEETKKYGKRVLLVMGGESFRKNGYYDTLASALSEADMEIFELSRIKAPMLSKVREGITFCRKNKIDVILGIGGGTCMDVAKTIAFGVAQEEDIWDYLSGKFDGIGCDHLPVGTIVTFPSSGSDIDGATQITSDETGEQMGLNSIFPNFAWLNPSYMMSIDADHLVRGQITAFVQLSIGYLGLERSDVSENVAIAIMKSILRNLKKSINEPTNKEARANLMLASALTVSGVTTMGKDGDWVMYPMQAVMQNACKVPYTVSLAVLFPYWLKVVYSGQDIFKEYFVKVFGLDINGKNDKEILYEGISKILEMYRSFNYPTTFTEVSNSIDEKTMKEMIDMLGPMPSIYTEFTTEKMKSMMLNSINGNI